MSSNSNQVLNQQNTTDWTWSFLKVNRSTFVLCQNTEIEWTMFTHFNVDQNCRVHYFRSKFALGSNFALQYASKFVLWNNFALKRWLKEILYKLMRKLGGKCLVLSKGRQNIVKLRCRKKRIFFMFIFLCSIRFFHELLGYLFPNSI